MLSLWIPVVVLASSGCGSTCPVPVEHEHTEAVEKILTDEIPYYADVEAISEKTGEVVHRAHGRLHWDHKKHIGGEQLRGVPFDIPDYEVNSSLITPEKVWTST